MPTGPRLLLENACYHIITRGNQRQQVFFDEQDSKAYLLRLARYKKRFGFLLYGYCLMPNHIHLIGEPGELNNLAKFMQGLTRSYTAYYNKRYKKVGHLWQGRFKSKAIVKDGYLIDCVHYIELNPIRANMVRAAGDYKWSSYAERILSQSTDSKMLDELHI